MEKAAVHDFAVFMLFRDGVPWPVCVLREPRAQLSTMQSSEDQNHICWRRSSRSALCSQGGKVLDEL